MLSGEPIVDGSERSGRKRIEVKLPNLLEDIRAIVDPQTQTDPSFKSIRLYNRISTGAKLTQQAMTELEQHIKRLPNSPKWFMEIMGKPI